MKNLKIVLQSNCFYYILIVFLLLYVLSFTKIVKYKSIYPNGNNIVGKVIKYEITDDKVSFILKGKEKIKATYYTKEKIDIKIGSRVNVTGELISPMNNTIPNTFNYKKYLYNNKIYKTINVSSLKINNTKINLLEKIKNFIKKRCGNDPYLNTLIVGDKFFLENEVYENYKKIGIAHLLAISGMHITVFIFIISKLLFFLKKSTQGSIISIFLLFYSYIVSFSASILRTTVFYIFNNLNKEFSLRISNLKVLLLTAGFLIIINPFIVYDVGFMYSFLTVLSIILIKKYLTTNYLKNILIISFFTMLFTLPITINLNYEINLLLFVSNLLFIPLITFIAYPFALITFIFPFLKNIFCILTNHLEMLLELLSKITIFTINIPKIIFLEIIIYYALLIAFVMYNSKKHLLFILLLIAIIKIKYNIFFSSKVFFFDVGQGDSMVLITPFKRDVVMIDTGGLPSYYNSNYNVSDNVILFLKSIGVTKINYLIITHGDSDHANDVINVINKVKVKNVVFNCGEHNNLEKSIITELKYKNINYNSCIKQINLSKYNLLFLNDKLFDNENDNSSVIYIIISNYKLLFMGDAGIKVESYILNKYNLSNIDVLKAGHHGSKTSSSKNFIDSIKTNYSIISVGKNNRYNHPAEEVLNNLKNTKIYRTDENGSIFFNINKDINVKTFNP